MTITRDVFLCHASRDKERLARPLYKALEATGLSVWFDEAQIAWGDPLTQAIQRGLSSSRYVLVLLTPDFVAPHGNWRQEELNAALAVQIDSGKTRVLPLVHALEHETLQEHLPLLAARRYERLDSEHEISALAWKVRQRLEETLRPTMLGRTKIDAAIGSVEQRLASARKEVCISGHDCKFIAESLSASIERALRSGVHVRILCVDPDSPAAEMLPSIDPRFPTPEEFRLSVRAVERVLRRMRSSHSKLEFRYLPILPAIGFFLIDPKLPGIIKIELYLAMPSQPIDSNPHLIIDNAMNEWSLYFIQQWENYWKLGRPPEGWGPPGN